MIYFASLIGIISNRYTVQNFVSRGLDSPSYTRDEDDNIIIYIPHSDNSIRQYNLRNIFNGNEDNMTAADREINNFISGYAQTEPEELNIIRRCNNLT